MLDKEKIKQSLTLKDIELVLKHLGSEPPQTDAKGNLVFNTVCHNITGGKFKLYYYVETKQFYCFTQCQESFDIFQLVIKNKKLRNIVMTFPEAVEYVSNLTNVAFTKNSAFEDDSNLTDKDWDYFDRVTKVKQKKEIVLPAHSSKVIEVFSNRHAQSWLDEGISDITMNKYNIRFYALKERIVIPHYDLNGKLIGIRGRATRPEEVDAGIKYMPLKVENVLYNHPIALNLYGLNHTKDAIKKAKKIIIFESEKSVLKCDTFYGDGNFSVAVCGSSISEYQKDTILSLGVDEVYFAFDKEFEDPDGHEARLYAQKLKKMAKKFLPYCKVGILWDENNLLGYKDSPADKDKETLELLIRDCYWMSVAT